MNLARVVACGLLLIDGIAWPIHFPLWTCLPWMAVAGATWWATGE